MTTPKINLTELRANAANFDGATYAYLPVSVPTLLALIDTAEAAIAVPEIQHAFKSTPELYRLREALNRFDHT